LINYDIFYQQKGCPSFRDFEDRNFINFKCSITLQLYIYMYILTLSLNGKGLKELTTWSCEP